MRLIVKIQMTKRHQGNYLQANRNFSELKKEYL